MTAFDLIRVNRAHDRANWADRPRVVGTDLADHLQTGETIYVVRHHPMIYYFAVATPATKYVLPPQLRLAEVANVLSNEPKFIVTLDHDIWDGGDNLSRRCRQSAESVPPPVAELLSDALTTRYELAGIYPGADVWGGEILSNAVCGARVYRLLSKDEPPPPGARRGEAGAGDHLSEQGK